jgi:hypothetical protein
VEERGEGEGENGRKRDLNFKRDMKKERKGDRKIE